MSEDSGFLSRWSRRKLAPRGDFPVGPGTSADPAAEVAPTDGGAADVLSPEELARLPRIEDLTAETDLLQFLRAGVPTVLRNAALRRMWALDPAVRDFVGDARDYAYDWNMAGGVPGNGPLSAADGVEGLITRMFASGGGPSGDGPADPREDADARIDGEVMWEPPTCPDVADEGEKPERLSTGGEASLSIAAAAPSAQAAIPTEAAPKRRHGSAIPTLE